MARQQRRRQRGRTKRKRWQWSFPLQRRNLQLIAGAIGLMVVGYLLMATAISDDPEEILQIWNNVWAVVVAPILLVIAYVVIVPYALMWYTDKESSNRT